MTIKATSTLQKISIEDSVSIYVSNVSNYISKLKVASTKEKSTRCIKADLIKQYLIMHPDIDSITITPTCKGVSYFRKDLNIFENIIIE